MSNKTALLVIAMAFIASIAVIPVVDVSADDNVNDESVPDKGGLLISPGPKAPADKPGETILPMQEDRPKDMPPEFDDGMMYILDAPPTFPEEDDDSGNNLLYDCVLVLIIALVLLGLLHVLEHRKK